MGKIYTQIVILFRNVKFSERGNVGISRKKVKTMRLCFTKCIQVELEHRNKKFGIFVDQK